MPDTSNISFLDRVRAILSDLPASERRLAQFTLDFSGDLSSYNASELASLAQVSNATVTRLIRRLEYANYEAARKQIRTERTDDSFTSVHQPLSPGEAALHSHLPESYSKLAATPASRFCSCRWRLSASASPWAGAAPPAAGSTRPTSPFATAASNTWATTSFT